MHNLIRYFEYTRVLEIEILSSIQTASISVSQNWVSSVAGMKKPIVQIGNWTALGNSNFVSVDHFPLWQFIRLIEVKLEHNLNLPPRWSVKGHLRSFDWISDKVDPSVIEWQLFDIWTINVSYLCTASSKQIRKNVASKIQIDLCVKCSHICYATPVLWERSCHILHDQSINCMILQILKSPNVIYVQEISIQIYSRRSLN